MRNRIALMAAVAAALAGATAAAAAPTAADLCAAAKMKAASKYASCRLAVEAKASATGAAIDYTSCDAKQGRLFAKAEAKYGADCATSDDSASVKSDMDEALDCVSTGLAGTPGACDVAVATLCGNGVVDPGEVCDQGDLAGKTCSTETAGVDNLGTLTCGADCLSFDTSACVKCPATNSTLVGGQCWVLGAVGASCDGACGAAGMIYSSATTSITTLAACGSLLDTLGASADVVQNSGPIDPIGCNQTGSLFYMRIGGTPTSSSFYVSSRRACACQ